MAFIVNNTTASYIDDEAIDIRAEVPAGIWATVYSKYRGIFLEKYGYNLEHGKIYGKSQRIADHIFEAFKKTDTNLGVLLSGGKGLGKSLTARLVVEKAVHEKVPVIVVNDYIPDIVTFLKKVSGCVILFDEFEKTFGGKANENTEDANALSKQEEMLSLFDGTSDKGHNLYIMTVNDAQKINVNMKSRPGRIKYHYRYESENEETICEYCADNLKKPELKQDIVNALLANRYVSLDIIKALVDEVNAFDVTVDEALEYLNVETDRIPVSGKITYYAFGKKFSEDIYFGNYLPGQKILRASVEAENDGLEYSFYVSIPMKNIKIPAIGSLDVSDIAQIDNCESGDSKEKFDLHVTSVEIHEEGALMKSDRVQRSFSI